MGDPLPNDDQRRQLCELLHAAFVELRTVSNDSEQVHELSYAFHNLPLTMYGWGTWSWGGLRAVLVRYRERFPRGGPDYAAMLDAIHSIDQTKPCNGS
ncbi:MAG: hypothetical protein ACRC8S_03545 [Fimbriiglobus sp.]